MTDTDHGQWTEYEFGPYTLAIGCAAGIRTKSWRLQRRALSEDFDAAIAHLQRHDVKFRIEPLSTAVCRMAMIQVI